MDSHQLVQFSKELQKGYEEDQLLNPEEGSLEPEWRQILKAALAVAKKSIPNSNVQSEFQGQIDTEILKLLHEYNNFETDRLVLQRYDYNTQTSINRGIETQPARPKSASRRHSDSSDNYAEDFETNQQYQYQQEPPKNNAVKKKKKIIDYSRISTLAKPYHNAYNRFAYHNQIKASSNNSSRPTHEANKPEWNDITRKDYSHTKQRKYQLVYTKDDLLRTIYDKHQYYKEQVEAAYGNQQPISSSEQPLTDVNNTEPTQPVIDVHETALPPPPRPLSANKPSRPTSAKPSHQRTVIPANAAATKPPRPKSAGSRVSTVKETSKPSIPSTVVSSSSNNNNKQEDVSDTTDNPIPSVAAQVKQEPVVQTVNNAAITGNISKSLAWSKHFGQQGREKQVQLLKEKRLRTEKLIGTKGQPEDFIVLIDEMIHAMMRKFTYLLSSIGGYGHRYRQAVKEVFRHPSTEHSADSDQAFNSMNKIKQLLIKQLHGPSLNEVGDETIPFPKQQNTEEKEVSTESPNHQVIRILAEKLKSFTKEERQMYHLINWLLCIPNHRSNLHEIITIIVWLGSANHGSITAAEEEEQQSSESTNVDDEQGNHIEEGQAAAISARKLLDDDKMYAHYHKTMTISLQELLHAGNEIDSDRSAQKEKHSKQLTQNILTDLKEFYVLQPRKKTIVEWNTLMNQQGVAVPTSSHATNITTSSVPMPPPPGSGSHSFIASRPSTANNPRRRTSTEPYDPNNVMDHTIPAQDLLILHQQHDNSLGKSLIDPKSLQESSVTSPRSYHAGRSYRSTTITGQSSTIHTAAATTAAEVGGFASMSMPLSMMMSSTMRCKSPTVHTPSTSTIYQMATTTTTSIPSSPDGILDPFVVEQERKLLQQEQLLQQASKPMKPSNTGKIRRLGEDAYLDNNQGHLSPKKRVWLEQQQQYEKQLQQQQQEIEEEEKKVTASKSRLSSANAHGSSRAAATGAAFVVDTTTAAVGARRGSSLLPSRGRGGGLMDNEQSATILIPFHTHIGLLNYLSTTPTVSITTEHTRNDYRSNDYLTKYQCQQYVKDQKVLEEIHYEPNIPPKYFLSSYHNSSSSHADQHATAAKVSVSIHQKEEYPQGGGEGLTTTRMKEKDAPSSSSSVYTVEGTTSVEIAYEEEREDEEAEKEEEEGEEIHDRTMGKSASGLFQMSQLQAPLPVPVTITPAVPPATHPFESFPTPPTTTHTLPEGIDDPLASLNLEHLFFQYIPPLSTRQQTMLVYSLLSDCIRAFILQCYVLVKYTLAGKEIGLADLEHIFGFEVFHIILGKSKMQKLWKWLSVNQRNPMNFQSSYHQSFTLYLELALQKIYAYWPNLKLQLSTPPIPTPVPSAVPGAVPGTTTSIPAAVHNIDTLPTSSMIVEGYPSQLDAHSFLQPSTTTTNTVKPVIPPPPHPVPTPTAVPSTAATATTTCQVILQWDKRTKVQQYFRHPDSYHPNLNCI